MSNKLSGESSPYLLQHQDNPVDWYPWGEEALEQSRSSGRPIFLSIGYAACHWCHVMAHESFEDAEVASLMNRYFVNIKVDREERPDLDGIYMNAVVAMTGHGGWPMSVFLTPELEPFYGGTYYPPVRRYNMPSFREVISGVATAWQNKQEGIREAAAHLRARLEQELSASLPDGQLQPEASERASMALAQSYDWKYGGWGKAPKFPQAMAVEFLIRRAVRGDKLAEFVASHALTAMAQGGMYDLLGGGFHRYSVDDRWLIPHFEKMLYDNALLARAYLHGYLVSGEALFRSVAVETIDFVIREMAHPDGGFFSSLDADSEGEEGRFYIWSWDELNRLVPDPAEFGLLSQSFEISPEGNFEGSIVLRRAHPGRNPGVDKNPSPTGSMETLDRVLQRLFEARSLRIRPSTDDKVLSGWNGLMLTAISEAARYLKREDYKLVAIRNAEFLLGKMVRDGRLKRAWREGVSRVDAFLDDYAAVTLGLLALYQTDPNPRWFLAASRLAAEMIESFQDPRGGFFDTPASQKDLLLRPKDQQDNATPSGNSLAASALLTLAALEGDPDLQSQGERQIASALPLAERYPTAFGNWLCAFDFALGPVLEVALVGPHQDDRTKALGDCLWSIFAPNLVAAQSDLPYQNGSPRLLEGRPLVAGGPAAYVCRKFTCELPATEADRFREQLLAGGGLAIPVTPQ